MQDGEDGEAGLALIAEHVETYHGGAVEVQATSDKGRILVAMRDFEPGERILLEYPLVEVAVDKAHPAYQTLVRLKEEGRLEAAPPLFYWAALSTLTAAEVAEARCPAWCTVSVHTQFQALQLHAPPEACKSPSATTLAVVEELWPPDSGLDLLRFERLLQVWVYNSFDQGGGGDDAMHAGGLYLAASMLSHACVPNAAWHLDECNSYHLHAREAIGEGEEITIPYLSVDDLSLPIADRRQILKASKDFLCSCPRCTAPLEDTRVFRCPCCAGVAFAAASASTHTASTVPESAEAATLLCDTCGGALPPADVAPLLALEEDLTSWARQRPQFHQSSSSEAADEAEVHDGPQPSALEILCRAEAGGLASGHWAMDAARSAAAEEQPQEACNLLRQRVAALDTAGTWVMSKTARLRLELARRLAGKASTSEALREATDLFANAAQTFALLFGDEDPEYRESVRLGELTERQLALGDAKRSRAGGVRQPAADNEGLSAGLPGTCPQGSKEDARRSRAGGARQAAAANEGADPRQPAAADSSSVCVPSSGRAGKRAATAARRQHRK